MTKDTTIRPQLQLSDLTIIVMGLVIGMGIFRTPVTVAKTANQTDIFFMVWLAGGIVSFTGALIFAEIGSRYPKAGGFYQLFSHAYHPRFAFMVNWITVISNAASSALVALLGAEYLAPWFVSIWPHETAVMIIAIGAVSLLFAINYLGIKLSSRILNGLMTVKLGLLLVIIGSIFFLPSVPPSLTEGTSSFSPLEGGWWNAFALCFVPVFFTYGGYQQTMNFGGDVFKASRTLPKAILLGMLLVTFLYMLTNYAYVHALGLPGVQNNDTLAVAIPALLFGPTAGKFVSIIMFLSVMAYVHVSIMSNPRVYFAMAQDGMMPKLFARVNPRTQVQVYALVFFTSIILITLFFASSFEYLLQYVMFFDSIGFMAAAGAIFIYRRKNITTEHAPFIMKGYPWLPIGFILIYLILTCVVFIHHPTTALISCGLFILGWPIYQWIQHLQARKGP